MYHGEKLGVDVDRLTKSHLELADEGIEYEKEGEGKGGLTQ